MTEQQAYRPTKKELRQAALSACAIKFFLVEGALQYERKGKCNPLPEQQVLAEMFLLCVERRRAWPGSFRVVLHKVKEEFRDPISHLWKRYVPTLLEIQYLDQDGDVQFVTEYPDGILTIIEEIGVSRMADEAEEAYDRWKKFIDPIGIKPEQTYKRAAGEKSITGIEAPMSMVSGA